MPHPRRHRRALPLLLATVVALCLGPPAFAQTCAHELEPNDAPADATPLGERACLVGALEGEDQDAWWWVVDEAASELAWHLEIESIPGQLTRLDVLRIDFAANGVDVAGFDTLLGFGTSDGRLNASEPFLVAPGRYLLALSKSGGEGDYVVHLRAGERLARGRNEGRADADADGAFGRATVLEGPTEIAWTLGPDASAQRWALRAQGALGAPPTVELLDPSGARVARATADDLGRVALASLGLAAGTYRILVDGVGPLTLDAVATGTITDGDEVEPNDRWEQANLLTFERPLRGTGTNADFYVIEVGPEQAGRPWDLAVEASADIDLRVFDEARTELQRRRGSGGTLTGLVFAEGRYGLSVQHGSDGAYTLTFAPGEPLQEGYEVEPNDAVPGATPLGDELTVRGVLTPQDRDTFRFEVAGAPQTWRVQAIGDGVEELAVLGANGEEIQRLRSDGGRVRLDQLVLLPGTHFVRVSGDEGAYALRLLALGPAPEPPAPDPLAEPDEDPAPLAAAQAAAPIEDAAAAGPPPPPGAIETEPNGDLSRSELLEFGLVRVGTIGSVDDVDVYRFHLSEDRPVRIELASPEGSALYFDLMGAGVRAEADAPGGRAWLERTLLAGPYELRVDDRVGDTGWYQLRMTPLDPLAHPGDREPNDASATARPLPSDLRVAGHVGETGDPDFYRLPTYATPVRVELAADLAAGIQLALMGDATLGRPDPDTGAYAFELPADARVDLRVTGRGAYALEFAFATAPDPTQLAPAAGASDASLDFGLPTLPVQAFAADGQRVERTLSVHNPSDRERTFAVEAFVDHPTSTVETPATLTVPAGGRVDLPVTAHLAADLRDDLALHLTIGLRDDAGIATDTLRLAPVCEAPAVAPQPWWPLPEPLLGRFDVAWQGLGGRALDEEAQRARAAIDGRATPAYGAYRAADAPLDVDLAGDAPVTLLGTVLHPLADVSVDRQLRAFEVWTSLDGATYTQALAGELRAARVEQPFVFEAPIAARFARLVFVDDHRGNAGGYLGEWRLIGDDATALGELNLADPALGGTVVWSDPVQGDRDEVLDATITRTSLRDPPPEVTWVLGFHHGRAAQLARLEWLPPTEGEASERFTEVTVSVGLDGPIGPWTPLGTWDVGGDAPRTWTLDAPTWARYLRFDARGHDPSQRRVYLPTQIGVIERTADATYRSALGAWGLGQRAATFEHAVGRPSTPVPDDLADDDAPDRARPVASGAVATGTVAVAEDVDWLRMAVPAGENRLEVRLSGDPSVAYALLDAAGAAVTHDVVEDGEARVLTAFVEPGDYLLRLEEPKRSVVFAWDTSGSVSPYTPITYAALAGFARDLDPDREVVQLLAFDDPTPTWLLPYWSADPLRATRALNEYDRAADSSNSYIALLEATIALGEREGTRALLLITDAETPGHDLTAKLWRAFESVRPRVFTFEVSSGGNARPEDLMQSWSAVADGVYDLASGVGDLDAGFARASCLLRRPKPYRVEVTTAYEAPPGPGTLRVVRGEGAAQPAVEVIFDASGSMGQRLPSGESRIDVAKGVLEEFVRTGLPDDVPFALRAFGHITPNSCETRLDVPLAPLDRDAALAAVRAIEPKLFSQTPIAASIEAVADDLASAAGPKSILLITDGVESCDGDPQAAVEGLRAAGLDVQLAIVSLGLDDPEDVAAFEALAEAVGASYVGVSDLAGLRDAVLTALAVPYQVLALDGTVVATGVVDGDPVDLPAGSYRVRVGIEVLDARVPGDGAVEVATGR
jgi:Mg-chelatase subunit ChlD